MSPETTQVLGHKDRLLGLFGLGVIDNLWLLHRLLEFFPQLVNLPFKPLFNLQHLAIVSNHFLRWLGNRFVLNILRRHFLTHSHDLSVMLANPLFDLQLRFPKLIYCRANSCQVSLNGLLLFIYLNLKVACDIFYGVLLRQILGPIRITVPSDISELVLP